MKNKHIILIIIGFIIIFLGIIFFINQFEDKYSEDVENVMVWEAPVLAGNLSIEPLGIIFVADYITFNDGNLNLTFDEIFLSFEDVDYIGWNIKNKTYKYFKEIKGEGK